MGIQPELTSNRLIDCPHWRSVFSSVFKEQTRTSRIGAAHAFWAWCLLPRKAQRALQGRETTLAISGRASQLGPRTPQELTRGELGSSKSSRWVSHSQQRELRRRSTDYIEQVIVRFSLAQEYPPALQPRY
jgi:hypothetical protein